MKKKNFVLITLILCQNSLGQTFTFTELNNLVSLSHPEGIIEVLETKHFHYIGKQYSFTLPDSIVPARGTYIPLEKEGLFYVDSDPYKKYPLNKNEYWLWYSDKDEFKEEKSIDCTININKDFPSNRPNNTYEISLQFYAKSRQDFEYLSEKIKTYCKKLPDSYDNTWINKNGTQYIVQKNFCEPCGKMIYEIMIYF